MVDKTRDMVFEGVCPECGSKNTKEVIFEHKDWMIWEFNCHDCNYVLVVPTVEFLKNISTVEVIHQERMNRKC